MRQHDICVSSLPTFLKAQAMRIEAVTHAISGLSFCVCAASRHALDQSFLKPQSAHNIYRALPNLNLIDFQQITRALCKDSHNLTG